MIKEAGRKLLKFYHPDKNINNPDYDSEKFYKVMKRMKRLVMKRRKIYNETQLILIKSNEIIKHQNTEEWNESFRKAIIKKIKELEEKLEKRTFFQWIL
jgi:hypothetical protein